MVDGDSFVKAFSRKLFVIAFVTAWIAAPAFPAIVCALTLPSEAPSELGEMPDCHRSSAHEQTASPDARSHRACCEDVATSCCLSALDVDGAVGGLASLDLSGAIAVVTAVVAPPLPFTSSSVVFVDDRAHSPPGSLFRVLRL